MLSAGLVVGVGRDGPPPAYAVERQPDGSVRLVVRDPTDPRELQRVFDEAGVPARVVIPDAGCVFPERRAAPGGTTITVHGPGAGPWIYVLRPDQLAGGALVVASFRWRGQPFSSVAVFAADGVPDCARTP